VEFEAAAEARNLRVVEEAEEDQFENAVRDLSLRYASQIEELQFEVAQLTQDKAVLALERDDARAEAREIADKGV